MAQTPQQPAESRRWQTPAAEVEDFVASIGTADWRETTDRQGRKAYCLPTGQVVCRDGEGRRCVTVYYAGYVSVFNTGDRHGAGFGTTTSIREGKIWAEADAFTA